MARRLLHCRGWPGRLAGDERFQLPAGNSSLVSQTSNRGGDPDPRGPTARRALRQNGHRQRNINERVIGWYKEYGALGTRHEKLAVNYVALWLVAMIERSLKRLFPHAV